MKIIVQWKRAEAGTFTTENVFSVDNTFSFNLLYIAFLLMQVVDFIIQTTVLSIAYLVCTIMIWLAVFDVIGQPIFIQIMWFAVLSMFICNCSLYLFYRALVESFIKNSQLKKKDG